MSKVLLDTNVVLRLLAETVGEAHGHEGAAEVVDAHLTPLARRGEELGAFLLQADGLEVPTEDLGKAELRELLAALVHEDGLRRLVIPRLRKKPSRAYARSSFWQSRVWPCSRNGGASSSGV